MLDGWCLTINFNYSYLSVLKKKGWLKKFINPIKYANCMLIIFFGWILDVIILIKLIYEY